MSDRGGTRVFVGGLNDTFKKEDLEGEFEKYGKLNSVWVAFNPPGFAFIEFVVEADAEKACEYLNGTNFLGVKLRVELARGKQRRSGGGGGRDGGNGFRGSRGRGNTSSGGGGFRNGSSNGDRYNRSRGGGGGGRYENGSGGGYSGGSRSRDDRYGGSGGGRDFGRRDSGSRDRYNGGSSRYESSRPSYRSRSPTGGGYAGRR